MGYANAGHNVHHAIRYQVCSISAAYLQVRNGLKIEGRKQAETAVVQLMSEALLSRRNFSTLLDALVRTTSARKETRGPRKILR